MPPNHSLLAQDGAAVVGAAHRNRVRTGLAGRKSLRRKVQTSYNRDRPVGEGATMATRPASTLGQVGP